MTDDTIHCDGDRSRPYDAPNGYGRCGHIVHWVWSTVDTRVVTRETKRTCTQPSRKAQTNGNALAIVPTDTASSIGVTVTTSALATVTPIDEAAEGLGGLQSTLHTHHCDFPKVLQAMRQEATRDGAERCFDAVMLRRGQPQSSLLRSARVHMGFPVRQRGWTRESWCAGC